MINNNENNIAFVLGAGFSKCADLPIQREFDRLLISNEFNNNSIDESITNVIKNFIKKIFDCEGKELPSLEDFFTCIDLSAGTGHTLSLDYEPKHLRAIRRMAIYRVFEILDKRYKEKYYIKKYFSSYLDRHNCSFVITNWDIVLEKHLKDYIKTKSKKINYCMQAFDWKTKTGMPLNGIPICKMHGSANWVYCENCKTIFCDLEYKIALYEKVGLSSFDFNLFDNNLSEKCFDPIVRNCKFCKYPVSSHIATFSYRKSFRTHAYPSIWYNAEKYLSNASEWIFVGYSLPEADYEFKHLLKVAQHRYRNLSAIRKIKVIIKDDNSTIDRFKKFFGTSTIEFFNEGFENYVHTLKEL